MTYLLAVITLIQLVLVDQPWLGQLFELCLTKLAYQMKLLVIDSFGTHSKLVLTQANQLLDLLLLAQHQLLQSMTMK